MEKGGPLRPSLLKNQSDSFSCILLHLSSMGDHLVLVMDHMLTEKTAGAAIKNKAPSVDLPPSGSLAECRICQEEDEESNMEAPCSCCGSLKYAHRVCVQRWCNEKGDIMCEICLQQFVPGYISTPKLFDDGRISTNFRGNWEISPRDADYDPYLTSVPTHNYFIGPEYNYYSTSNMRSIWYCRSVAVIFTVLLILRHALPILISGVERYSRTQIMLLLLRIAGIALPFYIMLRAVCTFSRSRRLSRQQERQVLSVSESEGEILRAQSFQGMQPQPYLTRVH